MGPTLDTLRELQQIELQIVDIRSQLAARERRVGIVAPLAAPDHLSSRPQGIQHLGGCGEKRTDAQATTHLADPPMRCGTSDGQRDATSDPPSVKSARNTLAKSTSPTKTC